MGLEKKLLNKSFENLKEEITNFRGGRPFNEISYGYLLNVIANPEIFFNRKLDNEEMRFLGNYLKNKKKEDFNNVLIPFFNDFLRYFSIINKDEYKDIEDLRKLRSEKEFLKYIVTEEIKTLNEFETKSYKRNGEIKLDLLVKENYSKLKRGNYKIKRNIPIDLYLYSIGKYTSTISDKKLEGFVLLRKKTSKSIIFKYLQEYSKWRYADKKFLDEIDFRKSELLSRRRDSFFELTKNILLCELKDSKNLYKRFDDIISYFSEFTTRRITKGFFERFLDLFFVDYVGCKVVVPYNQVNKISKYFESVPEKKGFYEIKYKRKDNFSNKIKDCSNVYVFHKNNVQLEVRVQPYEELLNAELGLNAHIDYKKRVREAVFKNLVEYSDLNKIICRMAYSFDVNPNYIMKHKIRHYKKLYSKLFN